MKLIQHAHIPIDEKLIINNMQMLGIPIIQEVSCFALFRNSAAYSC